MISALTSRSGLGAIFLFVAAGITWFEVSKLHVGTTEAMGPGYFPLILTLLFIGFGLILLVEAWQNSEDRIDLGPAKPLALILAGLLSYAFLLKVAGGIIAITALVVITALAEHRRPLKELITLSATIVVLVWIIFVLILRLQIPMLPTAWIS